MYIQFIHIVSIYIYYKGMIKLGIQIIVTSNKGRQ